MKIVYSREAHPRAGYERRNPRHFTGSEAGVEHVVIVGDYPAITDAYLAQGVPVEHHGRPDLDRKPAAVALISHQDEDPGVVVIPDDWRDLPWSQPDADGLSLRRLASLVSPEPVINKAQAVEAVEAELARREA